MKFCKGQCKCICSCGALVVLRFQTGTRQGAVAEEFLQGYFAQRKRTFMIFLFSGSAVSCQFHTDCMTESHWPCVAVIIGQRIHISIGCLSYQVAIANSAGVFVS